MWIYKQSTGELRRQALDAPLIATGYAGRGDGKNNTAMEGVRNIGPLPRGLYSMGLAYTDPHRGPVCIPLLPDALNDMKGRSGFLIHADSIADPGNASEGCIIFSLPTRKLLAESKDRWLVVA